MKISEIMDNYIDDEISIQCNELVSSERIKELTMKKISDQKLLKSKPFKMSTRLILAAAMVLVLGCGTVIAAVNKNAIEEYFQKYILGRELNDDEGVILSEISTDFSDKSGKQITVSSNGTDVTALSMLFDGHQFYQYSSRIPPLQRLPYFVGVSGWDECQKNTCSRKRNVVYYTWIRIYELCSGGISGVPYSHAKNQETVKKRLRYTEGTLPFGKEPNESGNI